MTAALKWNPPDRREWTVDDLAGLPEDLSYELLDGRLILPSPTSLHQYLAVEVLFALRPGCPPDYWPIPDLSLRVDRRNEPRPDVVVVRRKQCRVTPVPADDVLLAVEIISPESRIRDNHTKLKVYAAAGIGGYWVIDPSVAAGIVLTQHVLTDRGTYEVATVTDRVFATEVPFPVTIDLPRLTAERDDES